jgi:hypothetical protein
MKTIKCAFAAAFGKPIPLFLIDLAAQRTAALGRTGHRFVLTDELAQGIAAIGCGGRAVGIDRMPKHITRTGVVAERLAALSRAPATFVVLDVMAQRMAALNPAANALVLANGLATGLAALRR